MSTSPLAGGGKGNFTGTQARRASPLAGVRWSHRPPHPCRDCIPLGTMGDADLYFHPPTPDCDSTVVVRTENGWTCSAIGQRDGQLREAARRAVRLGFATYEQVGLADLYVLADIGCLECGGDTELRAFRTVGKGLHALRDLAGSRPVHFGPEEQLMDGETWDEHVVAWVGESGWRVVLYGLELAP